MNVGRERGGIHVIVGPMFAGKSTLLLKNAKEEALLGKKVALINSNKDVRFDTNSIVSHDGIGGSCYVVENLKEFRNGMGEAEYQKIEVIIIDEAQFFPDLLDFCETAADIDGKLIYVAGLDGDFKRRRFGNILNLICISDSVSKLLSKCDICFQPTPFTFRKTENMECELIGGSEIYQPLCRKHYKEKTVNKQK